MPGVVGCERKGSGDAPVSEVCDIVGLILAEGGGGVGSRSGAGMTVPATIDSLPKLKLGSSSCRPAGALEPYWVRRGGAADGIVAVFLQDDGSVRM